MLPDLLRSKDDSEQRLFKLRKGVKRILHIFTTLLLKCNKTANSDQSSSYHRILQWIVKCTAKNDRSSGDAPD